MSNTLKSSMMNLKDGGLEMSLISLIATENFISFMSDGRAIDTEKNEIDTENYKKITKVNDKIIIGIAGNKGTSQLLNEILHRYDQQNARSFANSMFNELIKNANEKITVSMHILIGGLDEQGKIFYTGFSNDSTELIEINPTNGVISHGCNESSSDLEISNFSRFKQLIEKNKYQVSKNIKGAKVIQEKLNAQVSMFDNSVNNKLFHEYIKRK